MRDYLRGACVIARRDFMVVVRSRTFLMFLAGPLFMVAMTLMGGTIDRAGETNERPVIGLAMSAPDDAAMLAARDALADRMAGPVPDFTIVRRLRPGEDFDARAALREGPEAYSGENAATQARLAAVISGTPRGPRLAAAPERIDAWQGMISTIAARAAAGETKEGMGAEPFPPVSAEPVAIGTDRRDNGRHTTAKIGQTLLFLLTMMLATMVLSNLVEEKGNKIIEVLAAAIPLESLFLGKLVAMLAVSFLGIGVWGAGAAAVFLAGSQALPALTAPAVGWPAFACLGVIYFAMAYLLLGSAYLAIGGIAATVRDIQTMALPASLLQVAMYAFAAYAMQRHGSAIEWAAMAFPLSTSYAMIARAATDAGLWPHVVAIVWQGIFVALFVSGGALLFRAKVLKSRPVIRRKGRLKAQRATKIA